MKLIASTALALSLLTGAALANTSAADPMPKTSEAPPAAAPAPAAKLDKEEQIAITQACHALQVITAERYMMLARLLATTTPGAEAQGQIDQITNVAIQTSNVFVKQGQVFDLYATKILGQSDDYHRQVTQDIKTGVIKMVTAVSIQPDESVMTRMNEKLNVCSTFFMDYILPELRAEIGEMIDQDRRPTQPTE